jgi:hypothetical protein
VNMSIGPKMMNSTHMLPTNRSWLTSSAPKLNNEACVRRLAFLSS